MDSTNPYQTPASGKPPVAEPPSRPRMFAYVMSLVGLVVLTAVSAPGDTGVWLRWALTIEFCVYGSFLLTQLFVLKGQLREKAIRSGPMFCFVASIVAVVTWTVAVENGLLPHPDHFPQYRVLGG